MSDKELYALCEGLWKRIRTRLHSVRLPTSHEWDDIRSEAIIRVFNGRQRLESERPVAPWAFTIMWRHALNAIRRFVLSKRHPNRRWSTAIRWARSIRTRVVETNSWGDECVIIEPDIEDETATGSETDISEFILTLTTEDRRVLEVAAEEPTISAIAKRLRWNYWITRSAVQRLTRAYQNHVQNPA